MLSASDIKNKIEENKKRMREEFLNKYPRFKSPEGELEWLSKLIESSVGDKTLEFRDFELIKVSNAEKFIEENIRGLAEGRYFNCVFFKETEEELKRLGYLVYVNNHSVKISIK